VQTISAKEEESLFILLIKLALLLLALENALCSYNRLEAYWFLLMLIRNRIAKLTNDDQM
jgi:hypothetical protein